MRKGRVPSTHPLYRGLQVEKALTLWRRKRGGGGERRGRRWEGGGKGGEKRRSKAEWKERVERVKIVEGRDANAS